MTLLSRIIKYLYDGQNRISAVQQQANASATVVTIVNGVTPHPFGPVRGVFFTNGLDNWTDRDLDYRVRTEYLERSSDDSLIQQRISDYDGQNVSGLNLDATAPSERQYMGYDDAGRLISAYGAYGNPSWSYDKAGNRLTDQLVSGGTTTLKTYAYPSTSNKLATITQSGTAVRTFTYDAAGNVSNDNRSGTAYAYTISNAGRIKQLTVGGTVKANYTYDHENRLVIRQTLNSTPSGTMHMIYDMRGHLIAEHDGSSGAAIREYIWLDDLPVAVMDNSAAPAAPTLLYVHADWLGRPEYMTNAAQSVVWKALYKPFGEVQSITGSATLNARFPGQWFQLEAGLHYNWWRHYDPTTGRYTQADPLGMNQGPGAPAPVSASHMAGAQVLSASLGATADLILGVGPSVPDQGPADLSAGFGTLGSVTPLGLATDFAAGSGGQRVMRDGPSLYGYAGQNPFAYKDPDGRFFWLPAIAAAGVAVLWPEPANAPGIGDAVLPSSPASPYLAGGIAGMTSAGGLFCALGREKSFGNNWRFAPGGNRSGNPFGRWPHYHRRGLDPANPGQTLEGQGIGRHRPWETKSTDQSFFDRF